MKKQIFKSRSSKGIILGLCAFLMMANSAFAGTVRNGEAARRIVLVGASYSTAETPPEGALKGVRLIHMDGKPFSALQEALTADPIARVLGPTVMKARNTWAGSFVEGTFLGSLAGFKDWDSALNQWLDLVSQNRVPSAPGPVQGAELFAPGDALVLGLFNDCAHDLAGTKPMCFDAGVPNANLANMLQKLSQIVTLAEQRGMIVYVPGYPAWANLNLEISKAVLLPPGTQTISAIDYPKLASAYRNHFLTRHPNVVFIDTSNIVATHIGDGMHLQRNYYDEVARRIMKSYAAKRGYSTSAIMAEYLANGICYFGSNCIQDAH